MPRDPNAIIPTSTYPHAHISLALSSVYKSPRAFLFLDSFHLHWTLARLGESMIHELYNLLRPRRDYFSASTTYIHPTTPRIYDFTTSYDGQHICTLQRALRTCCRHCQRRRGHVEGGPTQKRRNVQGSWPVACKVLRALQKEVRH
jgi:hypothetical protein